MMLYLKIKVGVKIMHIVLGIAAYLSNQYHNKDVTYARKNRPVYTLQDFFYNLGTD